MKKIRLFLLLLALTSIVTAQNRVIENPSCDFKTTGIDQITKIELGKNETRVYIHCTFLPKMWVTFPKNTFILDSKTGEKFVATGIIGTDFDKETYMSASGDSSFVLIFPTLNNNVQKIDYGSDTNGKPCIYGISLTARPSKAVSKEAVPAKIFKWLHDAVGQSKRQESVALNPGAFFSKDTARLVGYIKGYDVRSGFSTGIINYGNHLTRESSPIVAQIFPDGRFEAKFSLSYPMYTYISFNRKLVNFYIEPGQTLALVLDWEEFLISDRMRNSLYRFKDLVFMGPLTEINKDLLRVKLKDPDYKTLRNNVKNTTPDVLKTQQLMLLKENMSIIDQEVQKRKCSTEAIAILKANASLSSAGFLFDFLDARSSAARQDTANQILKMPVSSDYYDFLGKMPLNDLTLLISPDFGRFINRFEYCAPFMVGYMKMRYPRSIDKRNSPVDSYLELWNNCDSILQNVLHLKSNLVYEIAKTRSLSATMKAIGKDGARTLLNSQGKDITHPFLVQECERIFRNTYPDTQNASYPLPNGKGTDVLKKIIDPFRGKVLFVDFWATTCGPCVANIKTMKPVREKYKGNKDFEFVFITSEKESPQASYDQFVKKQELVHCYRLPADDFNYLRQLFEFNSIPHYVIIDKEGKVLNKNYTMYRFEADLNAILGKK
ncbi:MAG: TlpA disulfide reductase family protein [Bacteroidales bacterium]|nr:TlpA disulfide reductase family protein [Bacteroidales bacterium]